MEFKRDIHFIIGYLKQAIKIKHQPENFVEIILFLAQEIEKIEKTGIINDP